jgi:hypothetical protein
MIHHSTANIVAMKRTRNGVFARGIPPNARVNELKGGRILR